MANWSNPYGPWGDAGEKPSDNFQYDGGDQVNEKHIDFLWNNLKLTFDDVLAHTLQDDGSVKMDDGATAITFADDGGASETLFDMAVSGTPTAGTEQSVVGKIDGSAFFKAYAEADGSGGIQNSELRTLATLDLSGQDLLDGSSTIWDSTNGWVPEAVLENNDVTVTAGDGLKGGGTITLGGSLTVNVEPADFAGTFLSDDGADNLEVDIGAGLESDGAADPNIRVDEDYDFTFTSAIDFSAGLDTQGDITDGTTTIWDATNGWVPEAVLEKNSITVTAGDGLKTGGTVTLGGSVTVDIEPADFAGNALVDDGADNLAVASGGIGTAELDTSIAPSWTGTHSFGAGITDGAGNTMLDSVAASGQVTLSSGTAVVDTGITAVDATFLPAIGVDDPGADVKVASRLFWDDSDGSYWIEFVEHTNVGNPTVNFDIIRVR